MRIGILSKDDELVGPGESGEKDMIVSGGQNIYPADIETVLFEHPDIADAAVIGLSSEKWGETPVAILVQTKKVHRLSACRALPETVRTLRTWRFTLVDNGEFYALTYAAEGSRNTIQIGETIFRIPTLTTF